MIEKGIKGHQETTVTVANVATNIGSEKLTFSVKVYDERGLIGE